MDGGWARLAQRRMLLMGSARISALMSVRVESERFARLTLAFSKKLANLKASVAIHYAH